MNSIAPYREALRRVVATERTGFAPLLALRPAAGLAAVLAVGDATGHLIGGITVAVGALQVGVASMAGRFRAPLLMLTVTSLVTGVATFLGSVTGAHIALHVVVIAMWGLAAGMLSAFGSVTTAVGVQSTVALIVLGRFPLDVADSLQTGALVALGGLVQVALAAIIREPGRFRSERRAIGAAFGALADFARTIPTGGASLRAGEAAAEADGVLNRSWAAPGSVAREAFRALLTESRRTRLDLVALADGRARLAAEHSSYAVAATDAWLGRAASRLEILANRITAGRPEPEELPGHKTVRPPLAPLHLVGPEAPVPERAAWWFTRSRMDAVDGQLRAAERMTVRRRNRLQVDRPTAPSELRAAMSVLRANLTPSSTTLRHAARLAVVLPIAELVAHLLAARRGYWVPLTVVVVLRPDFSGTVVRGFARAGGTVLGVVLASVIAAELHPRGPWLIVLIAVLGYGAYCIFSANYALFATMLTALVVFLLDVVDPAPLSTAGDRLIDTLIGSALAFLAIFAWPSWEGPRLDARMAGLLTAQREYLSAVLRELADPGSTEPGRLRRLADGARLARSNAEVSISRAEGEPVSRAGDPALARSMVAAARQLISAAHTLAALTGSDTAVLPALPALAALADATDAALTTLSAAVTDHVPVPVLPDLRALHDRLPPADPAGDTNALRVELVLTETDRIVDSIDVFRDLLGQRNLPEVSASSTTR